MSDAHDTAPETPSVIAWKELLAQPWRNGGGVTRQILSRRRSDSGDWMQATDDWDLRLSIADVESTGAFSSFPGMTRILTVIEGASVSLTVDGAVEELEKHRPFEFDGGAETSASLPHGSIRDLNLIARTGVVDAGVGIWPLATSGPVRIKEAQFCVLLERQAFCGVDTADANAHGASGVELERFDTVVGTANSPVTITGNGVLAVISLGGLKSANATLSQPDHTGLR